MPHFLHECCFEYIFVDLSSHLVNSINIASYLNFRILKLEIDNLPNVKHTIKKEMGWIIQPG